MSSDELNPPQNSGNSSGNHCASCGAFMPPDLRFCRACGSRLGEDIAEYTETVRLQNPPPTAPAQQGSPNPLGFGAPGGQAFGAPAATQMQWAHKKKRKFSGMTWLFIGLLMFFVAAGVFTAFVRPIGPRGGVAVARAPRAYVGVDQFTDAEGGGATFDNVEPPDSPADKAGLLGGDVITSFDGHAIKDEDEITDLLGATTIGKAVEVIYVRDGQTLKTTLTPISRDELNGLERAFRARTIGRGRFGYNDDRSERVPVPGTNIYGVKLDWVEASLPADMAGIKVGDIIIEFGGVPIRTPGELKSRIWRAIPYETVDVVLMRGDQKLKIPVKMGRQN
jgi:PDZ domain